MMVRGRRGLGWYVKKMAFRILGKTNNSHTILLSLMRQTVGRSSDNHSTGIILDLYH